MANRIPYGYRIENGIAVINEEEQMKLKILMESYAAGASRAEGLRRAGFSGCRDWNKIMTNPVYRGEDPYYPRLLPDDLMDKVEKELKRRSVKYKGPERKPKNIPISVCTSFYIKADKIKETSNPVTFAKAFYNRIQSN